MIRRVQTLGTALREEIGPGEGTSSNRDHLEDALRWLYTSQDVTDNGGSAASYNLVLGWESAYPETTGYVIPTLFDVADVLDQDEPANRAIEMADWLTGIQLDSGGFPGGTYDGGEAEPNVFNTGQILLGLERAYRETENDEYAQSSIAAVNWLCEVQNGDGSWRKYDYKNISHSYSSRISWPMLQASESFSLEQGRRSAEANLEWVLEQQTENGWFEKCGFTRDKDPFLHTIAYTVRGLLESSRFLQGELADDCERAAMKTAERLLAEQRENGILRSSYDTDWNPSRSSYCLTGNAQIAAVWAQAAIRTQEPAFHEEVSRTVRFLKQKQVGRGPSQVQGALAGSAPIWGKYMYLRYPNWSTKFLVDAILADRSD